MMESSEAVGRFPILKYFGYEHLPEHLQDTSKRFYYLAHQMVMNDPEGRNSPQETAAGLRKLLEAKDCFVRAQLRL